MRRLVIPVLVLLPLAASCSRSADDGGGQAAAKDPVARRAELEKSPTGVEFVELGCAGCHGVDAPYHLRLKQSLGRPLPEVVQWILDPQAERPGTEMPSYKGTIDEARARRLAEWVQEYARTISAAPAS